LNVDLLSCKTLLRAWKLQKHHQFQSYQSLTEFDEI
jgi:hypothetical protein